MLGIGLVLRARPAHALLRVVGFGAVFAAFLAGRLVFRRTAATDELDTALGFARSSEPTRMRQAIASFRRFPEARPRWSPLVVEMLDHPDRVIRQAAAGLLGEARAPEAVAPLAARLGIEHDDELREGAVRALRAIGDPRAVPALAVAAGRDPEPDLAVAMAVAALELAGAEQDAELRRAADVLARVMIDEGAPRAARREAADALRAHVTLPLAVRDDPAAAAWWREHREAVNWQPAEHRFVAPVSGG